jgi:23S rRNA pseudouridine1911/1915/1917 synthase
VPATATGWEITPDELRSWIIEETPDWLVVNKPGCVVCHPSKTGPRSSLIGAAREYLGCDRLHMPFRLDRETSGVVLFVRDAALASTLQRAVEKRRVQKTYHAILTACLDATITVDAPLARSSTSRIWLKQSVVTPPQGQSAITRFVPLASNGEYTWARVEPRTGRLHQIRVHAAYLGHAIAGDKLYGPDESLFVEFIDHGFTGRVAENLPLSRQALHATEVRFDLDSALVFRAPLPADLLRFANSVGLPEDIDL